MPRRTPEKTSATTSSSSAASSSQADNLSEAQATVEAALSNSPEAARHADWATMSLSDKLGFIVNDILETMGPITDDIIARMKNDEYFFNDNHEDKAEIRRLKKAQVKTRE